MSQITRIESGARMSQAVVHNGMVYLAGQVGNPGESVTAQTQTVLAEIDRLLAAAGTDKSKILTAQIWLADINADFASWIARMSPWVTVIIGPASVVPSCST